MLPWICKISSFRISHCLRKFPSIFVVSLFTSSPEISIYDYLVNRHQFSPQCAEIVSSSSSSSAKFLHKPQNVDSVIKFFRENGFTMNHIQTAAQKLPWILSTNVETRIKPNIKVFQDFVFHPTDADISKLLKNSSSRMLFPVDLNAKLVPNIEYLKSCGICNLQIATYVCRYQTKFLAKLDKLEGFVRRVDEMGVARESKMFIAALQVVCSMTRKNWELKLKLFRELGFSEQNILLGFRKSPNDLLCLKGGSKR